ncbi:hypothetical protein JTE90_023945 [Oedothorax gibbosus]|uniref:Bestrophin homolog n=1 Tax=Oedothorax gibbosus TaxID=931172 RepID=A0AAV6TUC4_9ARAC|nr:hypothetical protein JTE90_023945 [Oedothorax gibbosus]
MIASPCTRPSRGTWKGVSVFSSAALARVRHWVSGVQRFLVPAFTFAWLLFFFRYLNLGKGSPGSLSAFVERYVSDYCDARLGYQDICLTPEKS